MELLEWVETNNFRISELGLGIKIWCWVGEWMNNIDRPVQTFVGERCCISVMMVIIVLFWSQVCKYIKLIKTLIRRECEPSNIVCPRLLV